MGKYKMIPLSEESDIALQDLINFVCPNGGCPTMNPGCINNCGGDDECGGNDTDNECYCGPTDPSCSDKGCNCGIWSRTLPPIY